MKKKMKFMRQNRDLNDYNKEKETAQTTTTIKCHTEHAQNMLQRHLECHTHYMCDCTGFGSDRRIHLQYLSNVKSFELGSHCTGLEIRASKTV